MNAEPGRAEASLQVGGERPIVRTVNIENINDLYGAAGSGVGEVEATTDGNAYTITGTAVSSRRGEPGTDADSAFRDQSAMWSRCVGDVSESHRTEPPK